MKTHGYLIGLKMLRTPIIAATILLTIGIAQPSLAGVDKNPQLVIEGTRFTYGKHTGTIRKDLSKKWVIITNRPFSTMKAILKNEVRKAQKEIVGKEVRKVKEAIRGKKPDKDDLSGIFSSDKDVPGIFKTVAPGVKQFEATLLSRDGRTTGSVAVVIGARKAYKVYTDSYGTEQLAAVTLNDNNVAIGQADVLNNKTKKTEQAISKGLGYLNVKSLNFSQREQEILRNLPSKPAGQLFESFPFISPFDKK